MDSTFTHALLDFEGKIIKKYRWTNQEYKWYIDNHPKEKVIKLDKPVYKSDYHKALELVGETLI